MISEKLADFFSQLKNAIANLPSAILSGIKNIFFPDMEDMKTEFLAFLEKINPPISDTSEIESVGGLLDVESSEPVDVTSDIQIGSIQFSNLKFMDLTYFKQGIVFFRPLINGFLGWLLGMFYYNQFLAFIGQAPAMVKAHNASVASESND